MNDIYDVKGLETPVWFGLNETLIFFGIFFLVIFLAWYIFRSKKEVQIQQKVDIYEEDFDIHAVITHLEVEKDALGELEFLQAVSDAFRKYKRIFSLSFEEIEQQNVLSAKEKSFFQKVYFDEYREDGIVDRDMIISEFKTLV